jgi:hypothetical protein
MSEKNSTNREHLVKVAALVRPALATRDYLPALMNIKFDGKLAVAYDDIHAIGVRSTLDLGCCIPGELLIRALGSFSADQIMLQPGDKENSVVLSSGRSKVKLPTLPNGSFPFKWPSISEADEVALDAAILKGIERCLISVGNDPTHPAQMGVTLDVSEKGHAVLFSTDNATISRYQTKTKIKLPADVPVIMPRFFCEQLVSLAKAFPEEPLQLFLHDGALRVDFGDAARLFTKLPVNPEPLDFPRMIAKHCPTKDLSDLVKPIPDSFDASLGRALLVLGTEVDKATRITIVDGLLKMHSTSKMGDSDDSMKYEGEWSGDNDNFHVDPGLLARASKVCGFIGFTERVTVLSDKEAQFMHLVAHCAV